MLCIHICNDFIGSWNFILGYAHLHREFPPWSLSWWCWDDFVLHFIYFYQEEGYCCSIIMKENSWFMSGFYSLQLYYCAFKVDFCSSPHLLQPKDIVVETSWKKLFWFMLGFFSLELYYYTLGWFCSLIRLPLIRDISVVKSRRSYFIYFIVLLQLYPAFLVFVDFRLNICRFLFSNVCIYVSIHSVTMKHFPCFSSNFHGSCWDVVCEQPILDCFCLSRPWLFSLCLSLCLVNFWYIMNAFLIAMTLFFQVFYALFF